MNCKNISKYFVICLLGFGSLQSFDWVKYLEKNKDLKSVGIHNWVTAFNHYLSKGISEGRISAEPIENSNFDYEFYIEKNGLQDLKDSKEAIKHYQNKGYFEQLTYCQKYNIVILLHLYDLSQMNEFIDKINYFMRINDQNNYFIKINIPIGNNIDSYKKSLQNVNVNQEEAANFLKTAMPYPIENFSTDINKLIEISTYLKKNLNIDSDKVQIIFSENRGVDIGGFFLLLDQLIKQNIEHDYIIKLHTKSDPMWRELLTSFLNLKINTTLRKNQCVYSNNIEFNCENETDINCKNVIDLLKYFDLQQNQFNFSGGTTFIVSSKFTDFFRKFDLLKLFDMCNPSQKIPKDGAIEHAFERIFGAVIEHLNLKTSIVDFIKFPYKTDNNSINKNFKQYDLQEMKSKIKEFNIKIMALYFPQFHEFEENNRFWGKGFTEWTLLNKFKGEIKKPHVDVGQYNMLDLETRKKQAILAKQHGIDAFCYYHYWFKNKKVMYKGLEKILEDNEPNLPFALCWANESWNKTWSGENRDVLLQQDYGNRLDWQKHYDYLLKFFKHPNYIKENNCPLLFIYKIDDIVQQKALGMLAEWKKLIQQDGFTDLKIIAILGPNKLTLGKSKYVNGYAEHQPNYKGGDIVFPSSRNGKHVMHDIQLAYDIIKANKKISDYYIRGVFYSFDNSSRRTQAPFASKFINLSYHAFQDLIVSTIENIALNPNKDNNFILLNSWNEWAEQAMIEPNDHDGYKILEIIKNIFR